MYLDAVRFEYSGDRVRARAYGRAARKMLFDLKRRTAESGIDSARDRQVMTDGTVIEVVLAGMLAMAHIHAPVIARAAEGRTFAYVASNATVPPRITVVDVEAEKELNIITGLGTLVGMAMHPDGRYLFAVNNTGLLAKLDVDELTASGVSVSGQPSDLFLSPDGERVHVRLWATGTPGAGGTYGAVRTYATEDLSLLVSHPDNLLSNQTHRTGVRAQDGRLYLTMFGDGDGDAGTNPAGGDYQEAIEVYDWAGGSMIAGEPLGPEHSPSSNYWRAAAVNPQGDRLFVASSTAVLAGVDQPTVKVFDVEGDNLNQLVETAVGYELTGDIAVSRSGNYAFVRDYDGLGYAILQSPERDQYTVSDPFPVRPSEVIDPELYPANRAIQIGPDRDPRPDTRVFFLSSTAQTLWAFKINMIVPDKQIALTERPDLFALGRATPKVQTP